MGCRQRWRGFSEAASQVPARGGWPGECPINGASQRLKNETQRSVTSCHFTAASSPRSASQPSWVARSRLGSSPPADGSPDPGIVSDDRFGRVDKRLVEVVPGFVEVGGRFIEVDERLVEVVGRSVGVPGRPREVDERLVQVVEGLVELDGRLVEVPEGPKRSTRGSSRSLDGPSRSTGGSSRSSGGSTTSTEGSTSLREGP